MNGDKFPKDRWNREECIKRPPWVKRKSNGAAWFRKHYRRLFRRIRDRDLYKMLKDEYADKTS